MTTQRENAPGSSLTRFARLALQGIHREYPNHLQHLVHGPGEAAEPHQLHPAFYGCFDWHSSVHSHWMLVRLLHKHPESLDRDRTIAALTLSFTEDKLAGECEYFSAPDRATYERPYGRAWLLQLTAELRQWQDPLAREWLSRLLPLEEIVVEQLLPWLDTLMYPVRTGTHNQTAFSFGLMLDWARVAGEDAFAAKLASISRGFYAGDRNADLNFEPSGEDFLSPTLMSADLMRRVMTTAEFSKWLTGFLTTIPHQADTAWLRPGKVRDRSDGRLVHLDGLNLSRAWALEAIADALPESDNRRAALLAAAEEHTAVGLAAVTDEHYAGSHWLASFAVYLLTRSRETKA